MGIIYQKVEPVSKKARVLELLKEAILSGAIQSGDQIVEGKIAQQFGVGQGLIREALIELEYQGFVQRTPFSGTQVPKLGPEDAKQIFDIRIELEPLAFALAMSNAGAELPKLQELCAKAKEGVDSSNLPYFFENHLAFRRKVWELSGNKYLQQMLERLVVPLFALYLIRGSFNRDGLLQTTVECVDHQETILKTFQAGDAEELKKIVRSFLVRMKKNLGSKLLPTT